MQETKNLLAEVAKAHYKNHIIDNSCRLEIIIYIPVFTLFFQFSHIVYLYFEMKIIGKNYFTQDSSAWVRSWLVR